LYLEANRRTELVPKSEKLRSFPAAFGPWQSKDVPIEADALAVLGPGDFLNRLYFEPGSSEPVSLFIAYFPSQKAGDTIHSPKNCLPGAGWTFSESGTAQIPIGGGKPITVGRYVISKGNNHQLVFYWYQAHGRSVVSEYWAKFYLVADSIRLNRTDGSLVRIITPFSSKEDSEAAEARLVGFGQQIMSVLDGYIPR